LASHAESERRDETARRIRFWSCLHLIRADYCSAIIFIALQKACVKALSASAPCEDYFSAIIFIALKKRLVKALSSSAPCEAYFSAIIFIALKKDCVKALSASAP